jgi:putative inorganic carbon (hco3(-)) transporter
MSGEQFRRYIVWAFRLLLVILPFVWTSSTSELFEFPKMLVVYSLTGIITALWLCRMIASKKIILAKTFLDLPLLLFLASQIISTLFSIDPHTSFWGYYSRFNGGLASTISYLLLYYALVSNLLQAETIKTIKIVVISTAVATLYAFFEHFGYSTSCLMITGSLTVDCWVQDVQTRVFGTFGQPNWLAAYLLTMFFIPVSYALTASPFKSWRFIWNASLVVLLFLTLLFTKSRSGVLGLALGLVVFIPSILFIYRSRLKTIVPKIAVGIVVLVSCFFAVGSGIIPQLDSFKASFNTSSPENPITQEVSAGPALEVGGTESSKIREIVWTGAVNLWKKYPLFGSGVETFAYSYYNVRPVEHNLVSEWDFLYNKAHNEFLNFLSTTGLFGLISYLAIIVTFTIWSLKMIIRAPTPIAHHDDQNQVLLLALISGYLALAVSNFFGFSTVPVALLFFLFPALAHLISLPPGESDQKPSPTTTSTAQTISFSIVAIILGFWLLQVSNMYQADVAYNRGKKALDAGELAPAITLLQKAVGIREEPIYYDSLSLATSQAAVAFAQTETGATQAQQFAQKAVEFSKQTLKRNQVHLNFYKTQVRMYIVLAQLNPQYVTAAQNSLIAALKLAPTDAKLWYNLGLLYDQLGKVEEAQKLYGETIKLKPNYEIARMNLALLYEASDAAKAMEQYQYVLTHINPNNQTAQEKVLTPSP